ncbi:hypothetical protein DP133_09325, partial [Clostridium tetani]
MATVSASLKMFDMMTRPLQQVTNALNLTESSMNRVANQNINMTSSLNTTRGAAQGATSGFNQLVNSQNRASNEQNNLNNSFNKGTNSANTLLNKVKGLVSAYLGFQAIKKGIDLTIVGAANLEQQLITISGMLGNKDVGKAFFEKINDYALISQYGLKDFAAISRQFIQFTKNTDKLMDLNKLSERLAFLDPTQGLEGAGFALKEILGGDGMSLKGRFGFAAGEIKQLKEATNMDDFMKKFDSMLNSKGGTQKAVEEAANTAASLWGNLMANITTSFSKAGKNALDVLKPTLQALNEAFKEGKFQTFFDSISVGLTLVANVAVGAFGLIKSGVDIASKVFDAVLINIENTGIALWTLSPIILGLVAAWGTYNTVIFITNALTTITNGLMVIWTFLTNG